jgi:hypothetical protein
VACKDIPIKDRLTYQLTSAEGEALVVPWLKVLGVLDFVGDDLARATAYAWKVGQDLCARGCVDPDSGQQCATRFGLAWSEYDAPEVCFLCSMAGGLGGGEVSKSGNEGYYRVDLPRSTSATTAVDCPSSMPRTDADLRNARPQRPRRRR